MLIHVHKPGTVVSLKNSVEAKVASVMIAPAGVQYLVIWWNGRERKKEWVEAFEVFELGSPMGLRIGFEMPPPEQKAQKGKRGL